jgi:hypothetical protein
MTRRTKRARFAVPFWYLEQQQRRKQALIKGPTEFRDIRDDLPKPK